MQNIKKKKITITLERKNDNVFLHLKIPIELERFFRKISNNETQKSIKWFSDINSNINTAAKFYKLTQEYQRIERKVNNNTNLNFFNDYGDGLIRDGSINLALLRTVGASKGVKLYCDRSWGIDNMDLENYVRHLGLFTKKLWEQVITRQKLKAIISFEI